MEFKDNKTYKIKFSCWNGPGEVVPAFENMAKIETKVNADINRVTKKIQEYINNFEDNKYINNLFESVSDKQKADNAKDKIRSIIEKWNELSLLSSDDKSAQTLRHLENLQQEIETLLAEIETWEREEKAKEVKLKVTEAEKPHEAKKEKKIASEEALALLDTIFAKLKAEANEEQRQKLEDFDFQELRPLREEVKALKTTEKKDLAEANRKLIADIAHCKDRLRLNFDLEYLKRVVDNILKEKEDTWLKKIESADPSVVGQKSHVYSDIKLTTVESALINKGKEDGLFGLDVKEINAQLGRINSYLHLEWEKKFGGREVKVEALKERFRNAAEAIEEISEQEFQKYAAKLELGSKTNLKQFILDNVDSIHEEHIDAPHPDENLSWEFVQGFVEKANDPNNAKKYIAVPGRGTFVIEKAAWEAIKSGADKGESKESNADAQLKAAAEQAIKKVKHLETEQEYEARGLTDANAVYYGDITKDAAYFAKHGRLPAGNHNSPADFEHTITKINAAELECYVYGNGEDCFTFLAQPKTSEKTQTKEVNDNESWSEKEQEKYEMVLGFARNFKQDLLEKLNSSESWQKLRDQYKNNFIEGRVVLFLDTLFEQESFFAKNQQEKVIEKIKQELFAAKEATQVAQETPKEQPETTAEQGIEEKEVEDIMKIYTQGSDVFQQAYDGKMSRVDLSNAAARKMFGHEIKPVFEKAGTGAYWLVSSIEDNTKKYLLLRIGTNLNGELTLVANAVAESFEIEGEIEKDSEAQMVRPAVLKQTEKGLEVSKKGLIKFKTSNN